MSKSASTNLAIRSAGAKSAFLLLVAVLLAAPGVVLADPSPQPAATAVPAPALPPGLPIPSSVLNSPYVQGLLNAVGGLTQTTNGPVAIGRVSYFKQFELQVETAPTVYRRIHLHQGTVINPRGTTLAPGMNVTVNGSSQTDGSLNADTITLR